MRYFLPLLLLLLVAACDTDDVSTTEYPSPGSYPIIALANVATNPAGRYNIEAYVASVFECPEGSQCIFPDNLTAVDVPPPATPTTLEIIVADRPSQFTVGALYLFSIDISGEPGPSRFITLLGAQAVSRLE